MNTWQTIVAIINVAGFIVITVLAMLSIRFGAEWGSAMMNNILPLLIGCWISNVTTILNYIFGTSQSSQRKSALIAKLTTGADPSVPPPRD